MPTSVLGPTSCGIGPIPDCPLASDCQNPCWSRPRALMTPIPDMTTRIYTIFIEDDCWTEGNKLHLVFDRFGLFGCNLGSGILLGIDQISDAVDHFANGLDLLCILV